MEELPSEYDVIVVGTGMTTSIVAAALGRIGKSVLHIDENDYYGEEWASFNLDSIESSLLTDACRRDNLSQSELDKHLKEFEKFTPIVLRRRCSSLSVKWNCNVSNGKENLDENQCEKAEQNDSKEEPLANDSKNNENICWTAEKLKQEYRKFNLDVCPKMLYSRGPLVELLISSNIARYAEFKSVSRVLTWRENRLEVVPCSRADVFATKHVSVVQKRMLVKILSLFAEYPECKDEFTGFENKTLVEYLKHKKLPDQLIHYILYAIAMSRDTTPCLEGVESCQKFLKSLGRYGNTPFIFPLYGAGEIPQCFCRLCAVFGGVYCLKRPIDGIITAEDGSALSIVSGNQRLSAKQFVFSSSYCQEDYVTPDTSPALLRAIFITDRSLVESEKEAITLLQFPPCSSHDKPVTIMEMGSSCHVTPKGLFLVHMTSEVDTSKDNSDLKHVQQTLLSGNEDEESGKPKVLWSLEWKMMRGSKTVTSACPSNVKVASGPDPGLDYDDSVKQAKEIFSELCPGEEFLPRTPDPEEIVMETPEPEQTEETNTEAVQEKGDGKDSTEEQRTTKECEEVKDGVQNSKNPSEPSEEAVLETSIEPKQDTIEEN